MRPQCYFSLLGCHRERIQVWRRLHQGVCADVLQAREHTQGDKNLINTNIRADSLRIQVPVVLNKGYHIFAIRYFTVSEPISITSYDRFFYLPTELTSVFTISFPNCLLI